MVRGDDGASDGDDDNEGISTAKLLSKERNEYPSTVASKSGKGSVASFFAAFAVPEVRRSLLVCVMLVLATVCQLLADTFISKLVGGLGSDLSAARGEVNTIMGFAFYVFGFLTDAVTSKVSTAAGTGDKALVGAWVKTAVLAGILSGLVTLLAFGPTYTLWLHTFEDDEGSSTWGLAVILYFTRLAGMVPNLVYNAITGILQGLQMPYYIVVNNIFLAMIDVGCNYLFLITFGWSAAGSPLGINVSFFLSLIFAIAYLMLYKPAKDSFTLQPWCNLLPRAAMWEFIVDSFSLMCRSFLVEMSAYLLPVVAKRFGQPQLVAYTTVVTELCKYSYYIPLGFGTASNMLGSYYRGKNDLVSFRRLLFAIPLFGLAMGALFVLLFLCAGPSIWANFFLYPTDPDFPAISSELEAVWWILILQQIANALLAVYEGTLYAAASFAFVRNVVLSGFILTFSPLIAIATWSVPTLTMAMSAKLAYDTYRCLFYAYMVHIRLPNLYAKAVATASEEKEDAPELDASSLHPSLSDSVNESSQALMFPSSHDGITNAAGASASSAPMPIVVRAKSLTHLFFGEDKVAPVVRMEGTSLPSSFFSNTNSIAGGTETQQLMATSPFSQPLSTRGVRGISRGGSQSRLQSQASADFEMASYNI